MRLDKMFFRKNTVVTATVITAVMVLVLWSACGIKANAAERADNDRMEYQIQENTFLKEIRNCMEEEGYYNSGVTLTKIMDTDGSREYKVMVHHSDIDLDDEEKIASIYLLLCQVSFEDENVMVNYRIF